MIGDDSFVIKRVPGDIAQPAEKDNQKIIVVDVKLHKFWNMPKL